MWSVEAPSTERAAPDLGSERDKTHQMKRDENMRDCLNSGTAMKGAGIFWKIVDSR